MLLEGAAGGSHRGAPIPLGHAFSKKKVFVWQSWPAKISLLSFVLVWGSVTNIPAHIGRTYSPHLIAIFTILVICSIIALHVHVPVFVRK